MREIKIIIISIIIALSFIQCKKYKVENPDYAIGIINFYTPRHLASATSALINYKFVVNGKEFNTQYANRAGGKERKVPPNGNYKEGDLFMVQYDKNNPDGPLCNRMLFDYPVKDSSDYRYYVTEFLTNPPK